jgi:hypothetical protein
MAGEIREVVIGDNGEANVPPGLDVTVPHPARVYNYLLGGKDNYAADRKAAESFLAGGAKILVGVRSNRAFLGRAVRFLAQECGIRQFLDIGTGLPSADNTHEVAQAVAPESRIAYVDNDRCKSGCAHSSEGWPGFLRLRGAEALRGVWRPLCLPADGGL